MNYWHSLIFIFKGVEYLIGENLSLLREHEVSIENSTAYFSIELEIAVLFDWGNIVIHENW